MTYLLIAWLYASGALLAHGLIIVQDEKRPRKRDHVARFVVAATWPVWTLVGVICGVTGLARP